MYLTTDLLRALGKHTYNWVERWIVHFTNNLVAYGSQHVTSSLIRKSSYQTTAIICCHISGHFVTDVRQRYYLKVAFSLLVTNVLRKKLYNCDNPVLKVFISYNINFTYHAIKPLKLGIFDTQYRIRERSVRWTAIPQAIRFSFGYSS